MLAALLPLSLRDALSRLPALTARLEPPETEMQQLQLPLYRATMREKAAKRPELNC
jgi:hypothetical protein